MKDESLSKYEKVNAIASKNFDDDIMSAIYDVIVRFHIQGPLFLYFHS